MLHEADNLVPLAQFEFSFNVAVTVEPFDLQAEWVDHDVAEHSFVEASVQHRGLTCKDALLSEVVLGCEAFKLRVGVFLKHVNQTLLRR